MSRRLFVSALLGAFLALPAAAGEPTQGHVLRVGLLGSQPANLADRSHESATGSTYFISSLMVRGLTALDSRGINGCSLCEELPSRSNGRIRPFTTPDGREGEQVTYHLRKGLAWDDGTPVKAHDFVSAWEAAIRHDSGHNRRRRILDEIERVSAPDDRTVIVHRKGRSCVADEYYYTPLPTHIVAAMGGSTDPIRTAPATPGVANGPFRMAGGADNGAVVLVPNEHWTGPKAPVDRIEVRFFPDTEALLGALKGGVINFVPQSVSLASAAERLEAEGDGTYQVVHRPARSLAQVSLNLGDERLADSRVREALYLALDRTSLADALGKGAIPANSFLTPTHPFAQDGNPLHTHDPVEAGRKLDSAGWRLGQDGIRRNGNGDALSFRLLAAPSLSARGDVERVVVQWRALGIEIKVEPLRGLSGMFDGGASMAMFGWYLENGPLVDFYIFDSNAIPTEQNGRTGANYFSYRNGEADALVGGLRDSCNKEERADLFARLQARVMTDLPLLPLYFVPEAMVVPSWLSVPAPTAPEFFHPEMIEHWKAKG